MYLSRRRCYYGTNQSFSGNSAQNSNTFQEIQLKVQLLSRKCSSMFKEFPRNPVENSMSFSIAAQNSRTFLEIQLRIQWLSRRSSSTCMVIQGNSAQNSRIFQDIQLKVQSTFQEIQFKFQRLARKFSSNFKGFLGHSVHRLSIPRNPAHNSNSIQNIQRLSRKDSPKFKEFAGDPAQNAGTFQGT